MGADEGAADALQRSHQARPAEALGVKFEFSQESFNGDADTMSPNKIMFVQGGTNLPVASGVDPRGFIMFIFTEIPNIVNIGFQIYSNGIDSNPNIWMRVFFNGWKSWKQIA